MRKHPALAHSDRARNIQDRLADAVTRFAGSMVFVYLHAAWFAAWIFCRVEGYPYGLLTMIVSLEAIFLSTFVLVSQNRDDARVQERTSYDHAQRAEMHERIKRIENRVLGLGATDGIDS